MTYLYQTQLAHLVKLAREPAWKAYSWARAQELESCPSGQWEGLSSDLKNAMLAKTSSKPLQGTGA